MAFSLSLCVIGNHEPGIMTVKYIYDNDSVKLVQVTTDAANILRRPATIRLETGSTWESWKSPSIDRGIKPLFIGVGSAANHFSSFRIPKAGLPPSGNKLSCNPRHHLYIICIYCIIIPILLPWRAAGYSIREQVTVKPSSTIPYPFNVIIEADR